MDQFKQYGIITLIGIALFGGMYSSIQLMEWQFFPYLQIAILSALTLLIGIIHYVHKDKSSSTFII
jgi:small basic protein